MNIWILIASVIITAIVLYIAYFVINKRSSLKHIKSDFMLRQISIIFAVLMTSFLTLIICKMFSLISTEPFKTIIGSGIQIPIIMMIFSFLHKIVHKKIFHNRLESESSMLTISYIISCIFVIILSGTYVKDMSMTLLFITILLGKFVWFDGASVNLKKEDWVSFFSQKFFWFIMAFCLVFIAIMCIADNYDADIALSIFLGMDFGMGIAGVIILAVELRKGKKKTTEISM